MGVTGIQPERPERVLNIIYKIPSHICVESYYKLISVNTVLEILLHGKGSPAMYVCARALHLPLKLCTCCIDLCRRCPLNLAALKLLPHQIGS